MWAELQVPSELRYLPVVEAWLLDTIQATLGEGVDWSQQSQRLRLVLVEAYTNVVRHAHRDRPDLPVRLRVDVDAQGLALRIWDHGPGFDLSNYQAPEPKHFSIGGYGWLIIQRLMDRVEYQAMNHQGNCLVVELALPMLSSGMS